MYPSSVAQTNHIAPAPRRVRGFAGGRSAFDTTHAIYVWEWPPYPQYYVPRQDVDMALLAAHGKPRHTPQGTAQTYELRVNGATRSNAARLILDSPIAEVVDTVRFTWDALDHWFEEDEEIFVHPRDPYTRVDALRSRRTVRVELDGVVLAESPASVMVFETALPTRYYLDRSDVRFDMLVPSETRTECPYKGRTTGYWSVAIGDKRTADVAWSYAFPTRQLLPITGLVAFLNEKVDIFIDGVAQPRPVTHMS